MKKRKKPSVLRYHFVSEKVDKEKYFHRFLILYYPWRREELMSPFKSYEEKFKHVYEEVKDSIKVYEPCRAQVESCLDDYDDSVVPQHIWDELACEREEESTREECTVRDEEYMHRDTSFVDNSLETQSSSRNKRNTYRMSLDETFVDDKVYYEMVRSLNEKQYELHSFIYAWCIEERLKDITKNDVEPFFTFLSGGEGVGKSHVVNTIYQSAIRALRKPGNDIEKPTVLLTATTGKAATNIDGITLHSAFSLPVKERGRQFEYKQPGAEKLNNMWCHYRCLKIIVIDTISMLKNQDLIHLNLTLQIIYENEKPFGGISILGVGDLLQLNPVGGSPVFSTRKDTYQALAGSLWQDCFKLFELSEIVRQKGDPEFAEILSRVRTNKYTAEDITFLKNLERNDHISEDVIHLYMTNKQASSHNEEMLKTSRVKLFLL